MNDHEILLKLLEGMERLDQRMTDLDAKVTALDAKVERHFEEIAQAVDLVVTVIGERIDESEKLVLGKIDDIENVTAQNAFDVQLMKRRA